MLDFFAKVIKITFIVVFILVVAAFFSTPDFTASCTDDLFKCFPQENEAFGQKMVQAFKCIFLNLACVAHEFISIFK